MEYSFLCRRLGPLPINIRSQINRAPLSLSPPLSEFLLPSLDAQARCSTRSPFFFVGWRWCGKEEGDEDDEVEEDEDMRLQKKKTRPLRV